MFFFVASLFEVCIVGLGWPAPKITTIAYAMSLFLWFASPRRGPVQPGVISWLGRNSYFIYLFHLLPIGKAGQIASRAGIDGDVPRFLCLFLTAKSMSAMAAWLGRRFIPSRLQRWVLG